MFALTLQGGMCQSTPPDVCKTPTPPAGSVPIPYVNIFQCNMVLPNTAAQKVSICSAPALTMKSKTAISSGDEPGTLGGMVSSKFIGDGEFTNGSQKVKIEGQSAVSQGAMTKHNKGNTVGMNSMAAQAKVQIS